VDQALEAGGYRTHEFGDSVLIERPARVPARLVQTHAIPHAA